MSLLDQAFLLSTWVDMSTLSELHVVAHDSKLKRKLLAVVETTI